jgi:hypothetical protein
LLGLILLAAAGLKLYGLQFQPFAQHGLLLQASVQIAIVEWEIVLGLWLLSGFARAGAWFAAIFTFLSFAAVSLRLAVIGVGIAIRLPTTPGYFARKAIFWTNKDQHSSIVFTLTGRVESPNEE